MSVTIINRLPLIERGIVTKASRVVQKAALDVEANAKNLAPVDTGFLKSDITYMPKGALHAEVDSMAEYATYVEYGTHKMMAQPYMVPAAEIVRPAFIAAMGHLV